jgi:DNA-binding transcriptional regulator YiaG
MQVSTAIPTNSQLRQIREHLGLSQAELASALGFRPQRGEHTVREWETDPDFHPTPLAWCALRYMLMVVEIYRETDAESPAHAKISRLLPETLR